MKNVVITGASGMIGGLILQECLQSEEIRSCTVLVRRSLEIDHTKLTEVIVPDFNDDSSYLDSLKKIDVTYFCIGVYTGKASREEFRKITVEYTATFAQALKKQSPESTFIFLSGEGADQTEKSKVMFALDKGVAENKLIELDFPKLHIFRPAYIYPVTPRKEPNFGYRVARILYPIMKIIYPTGVVTSEHLAKSMFKTGMTGGDKQIYNNKDIRKLEV